MLCISACAEKFVVFAFGEGLVLFPCYCALGVTYSRSRIYSGVF